MAADPVTGFGVEPSEDRPGAWVDFPFDRSLLERFREAFPRARWLRDTERWFVPGKTAALRATTWVEGEVAGLGSHADAKGRDAYAFEPLTSPYLDVGQDLIVRTAYSRAVVDLLRRTPWARWDPAARGWRLPFRAYESLRDRWPAIEAAARMAETRPDLSPDEKAARARRDASRRRRRVAVRRDDPPPLGAIVATAEFGVVLIEAVDETPVPPDEPFPGSDGDGPHVWAHWRMPTWRDLADIVPAATTGSSRYWWPPTEADLVERRRRLRESERARATRARSRTP